MDRVVIRKANEKDLPSILMLYSGIEDDNRSILDLDSAKKKLKRIGSYPNYSIYIAEINGTIVGTFELLIMDNLAHYGKPSAIIEDVVVREKNRRMGIGKAMMKFAMDTCRKEGCYKLVLSSNLRRKDAHKFYKALGFRLHGYSYVVNF